MVITPPVLIGKRVLIVEDELLVALLIEDFLAELGCSILGPCGSVAKALDAARTAAAWLVERGHEVRLQPGDAHAAGLDEYAVPEDKLAYELDLAVSLGGDGTMLRTVDLVCGASVPVLGVNIGHLGYLSEVAPEELTDAMVLFFEGDYEVEARMTLAVQVDAVGSVLYSALNEAVLVHTDSGHTVRLALALNDRPFTTYATDALIVASPTGSTAYNLSARGPIVSPRHRALVITPVSPHMLFDRPLVLDASEMIRIEVVGDRSAALVVDGREVAVLAPGDVVRCRAGAHDALLVSFGKRDFHHIVKTKFGLADG